jgi:hypothetical protein
VELLARRNQLEVALAALERRYPGMGRMGMPQDPVVERAQQQWERLRQQLDAIEQELVRSSRGPGTLPP